MSAARRRRSLLALIGVAAAAAAALPVVATTVTGAPGLPDLVSEPPADPYSQVYFDGRLLLRFDGYITNDASATSPLEIRATAFDGNFRATSVTQWVGTAGSPGFGGSQVGPPGGVGPQVQFENADGHNHFHLKYAAEYSLWNQDKTAQVALAQKTEAGFCLEDSLQQNGAPTPDDWIGYSAGSNNFCWLSKVDENGDPITPSDTLVMGISPGFKDLYHDGLAYQWVDITNVQPGNYQLAARVDPTNVITETNESNNSYKFLPYTVAGYLAQPVTTPQTGASKTVTLTAAQFGSPGGQRRFTIRSAPKHGTLSQAVGTTFTGPTVSYTPKAGYLGSDSFTYSAVTNGFGYPVTPAEATATLAGNTVAVGISGAPASMVAGTSTQLSAGVTGAPGGVTWSTSAGSISSAGLLSAPAAPPAGGKLTVTATSIENPEASAQAAITVTSPSGGPAPITLNMAAGNKLLSALKIGRKGPRTIVGKVVTGSTAGTVTFTTTFGRKVLGRCVVKAKARKAVICKITLKRSYPLTKVRITAKITVAGGKTAVRRSFVIR